MTKEQPVHGGQESEEGQELKKERTISGDCKAKMILSAMAGVISSLGKDMIERLEGIPLSEISTPYADLPESPDGVGKTRVVHGIEVGRPDKVKFAKSASEILDEDSKEGSASAEPEQSQESEEE